MLFRDILMNTEVSIKKGCFRLLYYRCVGKRAASVLLFIKFIIIVFVNLNYTSVSTIIIVVSELLQFYSKSVQQDMKKTSMKHRDAASRISKN